MATHRHRSPCWIAIAAILLCAAHGHARAQSGSAEALYSEGYRLLEAGKLVEACRTFEASNHAQPGAGTFLALGMCRERNGQIASAWSAYQAALARAKDQQKRQFAQTKIDELEPKLSYLTVLVSADNTDKMTLTSNGTVLDPMLWNRPLPVDGGDYVIEGRIPGRETWEATVHVPLERGAITAVVPDLEKHTRPVAPPEVGWTARRKVAVGFAVASVVAAGLGAWLDLQALDLNDQAYRLCPTERGCVSADRANALSDSGHRFWIASALTFGVAGASALTAGVLWLTGGRTNRGVAIAPVATSSGFAVVTTKRF